MQSSTSDKTARGGASHRLALAISLLVSMGIVGYLAWQLDWSAFAVELRRIRWAPLPLLLFMLLASVWMRAVRWKLLIPNSAGLSTMKLAEATLLGFFASFVLPLRAGELVRPLALSRSQPVRFSTALASVVTERFFDALTLLILLGLCLARVPAVPGYVLAGARTIGIVAAVLLALLALCYARPARVTGAAHGVLRRILQRRAPHAADRLAGAIEGFVGGLRGIAGGAALAAVVFWSAALWLLMAGWFHVVLLAFGESPSPWVGMTLNVMVALAIAAPSAPGFIGTFQAGCILALSILFGYSREFAVAYSVVAHMLQMILVLAGGFLVLHLQGLRLGQLRAAAPPPDPP